MASEKAASSQSNERAIDSIVLEEEIDPNYVPTDSEVVEYAKWLGMDLQNDRDLFWIAREGLMAPLPKNWKPCKTKDTEDIYYFNFATGDSTWDHPCDGYYKRLYEEEKKKKEVSKKESNDVVRSKAKMDVEQLLGKVEKKKKSKTTSSSLDSTSPMKAGTAIGGLVGATLEKKILPGLSKMAPLGGSSGSIAPLGNRLPPTSSSMAPKAGNEPIANASRSSSRDDELRESISSDNLSLSSKARRDEVTQGAVPKPITAVGIKSTKIPSSDAKIIPPESSSVASTTAISRAVSSHNRDAKDEESARENRRRYDDEDEDEDARSANSNRNSSSSSSNRDLRDRLKELEGSLESSDRKCQYLQERVADTENRLTKEKDLVATLRNDYDKVETALNRQLKDLRGQILKYQRQEDDLLAENKEYRVQLKELRRATTGTAEGAVDESALRALRDKLVETERLLQASQEELETLHASASKGIAAHEENVASLKRQVSAHGDSMEGLRFELGSLRREKEALVDELASEVSARDRLQRRLLELQEERSSAAAEKSATDGGEASDRLALERRMEELEVDVSDKNRELRALRVRAEDLGIANESMKKQREDLEKKCFDVEAALATTQAELAMTEGKIAAAVALSATADVSSEVLKLTNQLSVREQEIARVTSEKSARESAFKEGQEEIARLEGLLQRERAGAERARGSTNMETLLLETELAKNKASQQKLLENLTKMQEENVLLQSDAKIWEFKGVAASSEATQLKAMLDNERNERMRLSLELENVAALRRSAELDAQRARESAAAALAGASVVPTLQRLPAETAPRLTYGATIDNTSIHQGQAHGSIVELSIFVGRQQATMQRLEEELAAAKSTISKIEERDDVNKENSTSRNAPKNIIADSNSIEALVELLKDIAKPPAPAIAPAAPEYASNVASVSSIKIGWRNKVLKERHFVTDATALLRKKKASLRVIQDHLNRYKESWATVHKGTSREGVKEAMKAINKQAMSLNTAIKQMKFTQSWLQSRERSLDAFEVVVNSINASENASSISKTLEKLDVLGAQLDCELSTFSKDTINNDLSGAIFFTPDTMYDNTPDGERRALKSKKSVARRSPDPQSRNSDVCSIRAAQRALPPRPPTSFSTDVTASLYSNNYIVAAAAQQLQSDSCDRHAEWLGSLRQEIGRFAHVAGGAAAQTYSSRGPMATSALHLLPAAELFDA